MGIEQVNLAITSMLHLDKKIEELKLVMDNHFDINLIILRVLYE